jgi:hypothetical protein
MEYTPRQIQAFLDPESLHIVGMEGEAPHFGEGFHLKMAAKEFDEERQLIRCTFDVVEEAESADATVA